MSVKEQRHPSEDGRSVRAIRQEVKTAWTPASLIKKLIQVGEFLFPFIVVGLLWEFIVKGGMIRVETLPAPSTILYKFWELSWQKDVLFQHLSSSFYRLFIGYLLAASLGTTMGALLAIHRLLQAMFSPVLSILMAIPTIAWVPLLLITMGLGDRTVITAVFLGSFFAITFNTMRGIEMVNKDVVNVARLMGVNGFKLFVTVLLPGSLVSVITGLRLGIGYSWRALIGGEMLSALVEWGIGKMIYQARFWNDISVMFVGIIVIGLLGFLIDRLFLNWLEKETIEKWGLVAER